MAAAKRVTASVKLTPHDDQDLIAWWYSIPRGSRNAVLKDVMRDYIDRQRGGYRPIYPRSQPQPFAPQQFLQLVDDAAWLRTAINDLPRYVERLLQTVAAMPTATIQPVSSATPEVDEGSIHRREQRLRKAQW